jgi:predicted Zn finger-like uncharacterized protein
MKTVCPTCNTVYNIPDNKIPPGKSAVATCRKCGGKIVIERGTLPHPDKGAQAEVSSVPSPTSSYQASPESEVGGFEFITEQDAFRGYGGFWKRFAAAIVDGLILMVVGFIIGGFIGFVYGSATGRSAGGGPIGNLFGFILGWLYYAFMESSSTQGTLGKMVLGIKVTDLYGNRISFGRATGRHFGKIISTILLFIGYLMVAFTSKKQGLHDMMAGCLVVNRR